MSLRVPLLLACIATLATQASPGTSAATQQQAGHEPQIAEARQEGETGSETAAPEVKEEKKGPRLSDRLTLTAGPAVFSMRGRGKGTTRPRQTDFQVRSAPKSDLFLPLQQTTDLRFESATGEAFTLGASFQVSPRLMATADVVTSQTGSTSLFDNRRLAEFNRPGDFTLAEFQSTADAEYFEWNVGGALRAFPGKKRGEGSRAHVLVLMRYQKAAARYRFDAGRLTDNPFDPNTLSAPQFDAFGSSPANYALDYEALLGGVRIGGRISKRFSVEGMLAPILFARYEGRADLGLHGLLFVHGQRSSLVHLDPRFHVPNCNSTDTNPNNNCGLVDTELQVLPVKVEQKSNRARGLALDLNMDINLTENFGVLVGYHRQDYRSVGGTEKRLFAGDAFAGCQPDCDEQGILVTAQVVTQSLLATARFRWF